jgi:large subunit ribosomal protein L18
MAMLSSSERRKQRTRQRLKKCNKSGKPFLMVCRSNQHIQVQVVGLDGKVIVSASSAEKDVRTSLKSTSNKAAAEVIGTLIAERSKSKKVTDVVFDRGRYLYHGRVAALADAARKAGLSF